MDNESRPPAGEIRFQSTLDDVDWHAMKALLAADDFDNGRTPEELRRSFEASFASVIAYRDAQIVGTARVLSDGICNAYLVDVWTYTPYRGRGIASRMVRLLEEQLTGQHVALFTEHAEALYEKLGYREERTGMSRVIGTWLRKPAEINCAA